MLYEQARHPRLKPCGEGLLPHGVAALREIAGLPAAPHIRGLRFTAGRITVDADFPGEGGLVVRRDRFDAWLFAQAGATPNVDVRPGTAYRPGSTRFRVGADGIHSLFHRQLAGAYRPSRRVGLSTHVLGLEGLGDRVDVFFHDEGELYVAPTGGGEALVSALFDYRHFRRDGITHLLDKTWALRDRVSRLEFTTPVLASAPLGLHVPRIVDPEAGLLLIGDAAGASDPITASGLALALVATRSAAKAIVSGDLRQCERPAHELGVLMRWLGQNERRATRVLRYAPAIIKPLLASLVTPCPV